MDEAERKRFLDTLRQDDAFRADVRREILMEELLNLPQTVALLAAAINGLIEHQAEMQRQIMEIQAELIEIRGELTEMRGDLTETRGDVAALVTTTRNLLEIVQNGFTEFRQELRDIKSQLAS
jgi:predicted  nucleic acid-binding Zn-ribbon protein